MNGSGSPDGLGNLVQRLDPFSKEGLRLLTATVVVLLSVLFASAFVLPLKWLGHMPGASVFIPIFAVVVGLLSALLFSHDTLYYGSPEKNKYVRAFQTKWPSKYVARELRLDPNEARTIWFREFNKWSTPEHELHQQWKKTLQRGYACRLVYYLLRCCAILFWLSVAFLLAEGLSYWVLDCRLFSSQSLPVRGIFPLVSGSLWLALRLSNRTDPEGTTGVWRRFDEINELNIAAARDRIAQLHLRQAKGPSGAAECQGRDQSARI